MWRHTTLMIPALCGLALVAEKWTYRCSNFVRWTVLVAWVCLSCVIWFNFPQSETLLPRDPQGKYRAIQWTYAALNSVEPALINLLLIDLFFTGQEWAKLRRAGAEDFVRLKLRRVSEWLGDKTWLEGDRFTIGDLIMITTLRFLRHTDMVAEFPNLDAYVKRGEARPAFQRALSDQLAVFAANEPQLEGAAA